MARVAMTGTAAADPVADGAGAQAPATVVPPGMRSGPWNSYDRAQLQDAMMVARLAGASQVRQQMENPICSMALRGIDMGCPRRPQT